MAWNDENLKNFEKRLKLLEKAIEKVKETKDYKTLREDTNKIKNKFISDVKKFYKKADINLSDEDIAKRITPLESDTVKFEDFKKINDELKIFEGLNDLVKKDGYFNKEISKLEGMKPTFKQDLKKNKDENFISLTQHNLKNADPINAIDNQINACISKQLSYETLLDKYKVISTDDALKDFQQKKDAMEQVLKPIMEQLDKSVKSKGSNSVNASKVIEELKEIIANPLDIEKIQKLQKNIISDLDNAKQPLFGKSNFIPALKNLQKIDLSLVHYVGKKDGLLLKEILSESDFKKPEQISKTANSMNHIKNNNIKHEKNKVGRE